MSIRLFRGKDRPIVVSRDRFSRGVSEKLQDSTRARARARAQMISCLAGFSFFLSFQIGTRPPIKSAFGKPTEPGIIPTGNSRAASVFVSRVAFLSFFLLSFFLSLLIGCELSGPPGGERGRNLHGPRREKSGHGVAPGPRENREEGERTKKKRRAGGGNEKSRTMRDDGRRQGARCAT